MFANLCHDDIAQLTLTNGKHIDAIFNSDLNCFIDLNTLDSTNQIKYFEKDIAKS